MKVYQTKDIRNISLVGGAKSGKTTLAESMLFEAGQITRRGTIEDKNTVSDYRKIELERQNSVHSTVLYAEVNDRKLNIIDAPGFDDFVGETISALKVTDAAINVVNSQNGVEVGTEIAWRRCEEAQSPVIFAVNQLELEKSNFDETVNQMRAAFGNSVTIIQYPVNPGIGFNAFIDVMKMKMFKYPDGGGDLELVDIPDSEQAKAEELHGLLIEAAAENDEGLMETYFDKGTLSEEEIISGMRLGLAQRGFFPVLCVSGKMNMGVGRLMEFVANNAPAPDEAVAMKNEDGEEIACNAGEPFAAYVFKTSIEEHLGEITFFRVVRGEISEGNDVINTNTETKERLSQLFHFSGKNREKVSKITAGDIGATIKMKSTYSNQTLCEPKNQFTFEKVKYPNPKMRVAVKAKNSADDEKVGTILNEIHRVDPTLTVEYSKELKQVIFSGQGELHLNIAKWQIETLEGVPIEYIAPKIPYRETITKSAKASYRHKKQSGGAGQFGEVYMMIQPYTEGMANQTEFSVRGQDEHPLEWGGKLVFNNCIVGGAIDARFLPAILKGIMEKIEEGPLTGSYARDIVVNIYDGKMHPVDSNEISFKLAGRHAFREAFRNAGPKILEPIYNVEVIVPEERMGDVMTDLQGRRAIIMGMDADGNYQRIRARVPLAEMNKYSTALSSITSGRATYDMEYAEYVQVPMDVQEKLLKAYDEEQEEED